MSEEEQGTRFIYTDYNPAQGILYCIFERTAVTVYFITTNGHLILLRQQA